MSTDMSPTVPQNAQKSANDGAEKKSKKRRREEGQNQSGEVKAVVETESTPAKKQKKSTKDREVKAEPTADTESVLTEILVARKAKRGKRKHSEAQETGADTVDTKTAVEAVAAEPVVTAGEEPATEPTKKSKKKKKDRQESVSETNGDVVQEPAVAVVDEPRKTTKTKNPRKRKDRNPSPTQVNGASKEAGPQVQAIPDSQPSATTQTTAIDEKYLTTKSPFIQQTTSFYLALSPIAHHFALEGLCAEHISPLLLTYYPPLKGVVLSYSNPRLSESPEQGASASTSKEAKIILSQSIDEYAVTYVWLTADFVVFRPRRNTVLEGHVNLQNESILGLICYNYFNAGIERSRLPKDWQWVADESGEESGMLRAGRRDAAGHYVDAKGEKVDGRIVFKVKDFEATPGAENGSGSINIYGTLLGEAEDGKADEEVRQKTLVRDRPARR